MSITVIYYILVFLVGAITGGFLVGMIARGAVAGQSDEPVLHDAERRALEDRYADQLREKDELIAHARAEASQLASELTAARQEAEARVSNLNDDLLTAIEQRSRTNGNDGRILELTRLLEQKDNQISNLAQDLAEARANIGSVSAPVPRNTELEDALRQRELQVTRLTNELSEVRISLAEARAAMGSAPAPAPRNTELEDALRQRELQITRLTNELSEVKITLAAINQTHEVALRAKQSECDRILQEKEHALDRERTLITSTVREQLDEQRRQFAQTERALLDRLSTVSDQSLKSATEQFLAIANESFAKATEQSQADALKPEVVDELLHPVREALDRLERQNQLMDRRRDSAFDAIEKGIQQLSSEATQLANALRKPAAQGAWGETAIITILENAGLIAGENFILQESGEDNKKRTDVVIKLPQDRMLVIDSKAPLEAFWDGMNAPTEEARAMRMKAHARMVREHVKELGSAYYWSSYDALPDCVIMFLPTEGAYFAALEADPTLLQEAKDSGVYLANPMTVLNMAHIAAYVLADERVRQNAQEIKNLGSELYERLRMFGEHFTSVGQNLRQSVDSYNKALSWIDRNVMPTARKMQLLGTAKGKALQPPSHIEKNVNRFQSADLRELPVELTYDEEGAPEEH